MISIVILAHNKIDLTGRCLQHILASRGSEPFEVVCVDNASTESFAPLRVAFGDRSVPVRFVRNELNLSFSTANNRAVRHTTGDKLLFLNNDVLVGPDSLAALFAPLDTDARAGIVGARLLFPGNDGVQHAGIAQMFWGFASNFGAGAAHDDPRIAQQREVCAVTGAMLGIARDLFVEVGGFDQGFRWGYEDVDLCLKAWEAGRAVVYVPDAPSVHLESATLNARRLTSDEAENYDRYRSKWAHRLVAREQRYLNSLRDAGVRRVVVFGAGKAALGLSAALTEGGIEVAAFTTTREHDTGREFCGRPVVSLADTRALPFDRVMIGSQFYFQVEPHIAAFDPTGRPIFPVVW